MMELVKNHSLTPGKDLFFYRDHNGVELDFVIERGLNLLFMEAKAGERIDSRKLNFGKVVQLSTRSRIEATSTSSSLASNFIRNSRSTKSSWKV